MIRFIFETYEEREFRLRAWFAYRHLTQNSHLQKDERFSRFYSVADRFFIEKHTAYTGSALAARERIRCLFRFESEKPIEVNEEYIVSLIEEYNKNPSLLVFNK